MVSCSNRIRCPWRGGAFLVRKEMIIPVIMQPLLVLLITCFSCVTFLVTLHVLGYLFLSYHFSKKNIANPTLCYWIVCSLTYVTVVMENYVVPFMEIERAEHFIYVTLSLIALGCLVSSKALGTPAEGTWSSDTIENKFGTFHACPICRLKHSDRSYHCHVCQVCTPRYEYHCFWLDCCIGQKNLHFYLLGLFFGSLALAYTSHLTLTTICRPDYEFGILVPKDCSDVFLDKK